MIMKTSITYLSVALLMLLLPVATWAQSANYTLDESSTIVIKGTSTIHDWEADVEKMDANVMLATSQPEGEEPNNLVESFSITIPVESLESGKGNMNRKMYDALKKDDHPEIMFFLKSAPLVDKAAGGQSFTATLVDSSLTTTKEERGLKATGNLNIAGSLKEITFPVKATKINNNSFRFEGSYSLNMKEYDVDPPSAVFGTIKSGEEVTIEFNILVNKAGQ